MHTYGLPTFPVFEHLDLQHKHTINGIVAKFEAYSDYNYVSLFGWDTEGTVAISQLNNNLVVLFNDYTGGENFLAFIGKHKPEATIDTLLAYCKQQEMTPKLSLIPEVVISHLPKSARSRYIITEDPNNHDYLLSVDQLSKFASKHFATKRNLLNRFVRTHGEKVKNQLLDLTEPETLLQINVLMDEWQKSRGKSNEDVRQEFIALRRDLLYAEELGIQSFGTYLDGKLVAFNIFEITHDNLAMVHFDKANTAFEGVFEHLKQNFAKHLASLDIKIINYQQDVGIEGLKRAKSSWQPVGFLKKYTIEPKV